MLFLFISFYFILEDYSSVSFLYMLYGFYFYFILWAHKSMKV